MEPMSNDQWNKDPGEGEWKPQPSGSEGAYQGPASQPGQPAPGQDQPQQDWNQTWDQQTWNQGAESSTGGAPQWGAPSDQSFETDSDPQASASDVAAEQGAQQQSAGAPEVDHAGFQGQRAQSQESDWHSNASAGEWNQPAPARSAQDWNQQASASGQDWGQQPAPGQDWNQQAGQDWNQQAGQGWNQQHSSSAQEWNQAGTGAWHQQAPASGQDWNQQQSAQQPWDSQGQQQWGPPPGQAGYGAPAAPGQQWQPQTPTPAKPAGPGFGSLFDFSFSKPAVPAALGTLYKIATITIGAVLLINIITIAVSNYDASYVLLRSLTSAGEALVWLIVIRVIFEGIKALVSHSQPRDTTDDEEPAA